jgi:hypothetical protein
MSKNQSATLYVFIGVVLTLGVIIYSNQQKQSTQETPPPIKYDTTTWIPNEDSKIRQALIGKIYQDDSYDDGVNIKNTKGEFYEDGSFFQELTIEVEIGEGFDPVSVNIRFNGTFIIRDKYLYYDYNEDNFSFNSTQLMERYF